MPFRLSRRFVTRISASSLRRRAGRGAPRANIAAIADNAEPATFANTIAALELAEEALSRVAGTFNLAGADSTPAREALQRDLAPKMSAFASEVTMNAQLFQRIETLWQARETLGLSPEEARVLDLTRRGFVRAGRFWKARRATG